MTTNGTMQFMVFFVWLAVILQIGMLIMSGGSDPIIWACLAINLAAAAYVTSTAGNR